MQTHELKPLVSSVLEGGDAGELLKALMRLDREDIYGQSTIRFLMLQDKWDFTPKNEQDDAVEHLFGAFEARREQSSADYLKATHDIILELWGFEAESPKWHASAPIVNKKVSTKAETPKGEVKKTSRARKPTAVPTDEQLFANKDGLEGASSRLKKVIKIQRGE